MTSTPLILAATWVIISVLVILHQVSISMSSAWDHLPGNFIGNLIQNTDYNIDYIIDVNDDKKVHTKVQGYDPEYPFGNVMSSFFPVDAIIGYETDKNETYSILSRYASFSAILETPISTKYIIFPGNACSINLNQTLNSSDFKDKLIVLQRGDCTFVEKIRNLMNAGLEPSGIIIGNDSPHSGLITMYSNSFNLDGSVKVPLLFVTFEDYELFKNMESQNLELHIYTASIGSWLNLMLSMALSPPLLIILFYFMLKCYQKIRRKQRCKSNIKLVNNLSIYVYNTHHLISSSSFKEYLKLTNQHELKHVSSDDLDSENNSLQCGVPKGNSSSGSLNNTIINGIDLRKYKKQLNLLFAPGDYYPTYKCSICLDKFYELESTVLVLQCKHMFHQKCLSNWLINFKISCPLCNASFKNKNFPTTSSTITSGGENPINDGILIQPATNYGTFEIHWPTDGSESEPQPAGDLELMPLESEEPSSSRMWVPSSLAMVQTNDSETSSLSFYSTKSTQAGERAGSTSTSRGKPSSLNVREPEIFSAGPIGGGPESVNTTSTKQSLITASLDSYQSAISHSSIQLGSVSTHYSDAPSTLAYFNDSTPSNESQLTLDAIHFD